MYVTYNHQFGGIFQSAVESQTKDFTDASFVQSVCSTEVNDHQAEESDNGSHGFIVVLPVFFA